MIYYDLESYYVAVENEIELQKDIVTLRLREEQNGRILLGVEYVDAKDGETLYCVTFGK